MQKWEYMTAFVARTGRGNEDPLRVTRLNDKLLASGSFIEDLSNCPDWISFLASSGLEGWELVGLVGTTGGPHFEAVFKRPKE